MASYLQNIIEGAKSGYIASSAIPGLSPIAGGALGGAVGLAGTALQQYFEPSIQKAGLERAGMSPTTAIQKINPSESAEYKDSLQDYQVQNQAVNTARQAYNFNTENNPYLLEANKSAALKASNEATGSAWQLLKHQYEADQSRIAAENAQINLEFAKKFNEVGLKGAELTNKKLKVDTFLSNTTALLKVQEKMSEAQKTLFIKKQREYQTLLGEYQKIKTKGLKYDYENRSPKIIKKIGNIIEDIFPFVKKFW